MDTLYNDPILYNAAIPYNGEEAASSGATLSLSAFRAAPSMDVRRAVSAVDVVRVVALVAAVATAADLGEGATWGDAVATWGDAGVTWGSPSAPPIRLDAMRPPLSLVAEFHHAD